MLDAVLSLPSQKLDPDFDFPAIQTFLTIALLLLFLWIVQVISPHRRIQPHLFPVPVADDLLLFHIP